MYQINDSTATKSSVEERVKTSIPTSYGFLDEKFTNVSTIDSVTWTDYPGFIPAAQLDTNPSAIPGTHIKVEYHFDVYVTMEDSTQKIIQVVVSIEFE